MTRFVAIKGAVVLFLKLQLAGGQAIKPVGSPNSTAPLVDLGYAKFQGTTNSTAGIEYFRGLQ